MAEGVEGSGATIRLDRVDYLTPGLGASGQAPAFVEGVSYLGISPRKSDGFTVLSVRKAGASRAFNIEVDNVVSVAAHGQTFKPLAPAGRWRLRAAELRAFIEQAPLEEWARPYFDPASDKYFGREETEGQDNAGTAASALPDRRGCLSVVLVLAVAVGGPCLALWLA